MIMYFRQAGLPDWDDLVQLRISAEKRANPHGQWLNRERGLAQLRSRLENGEMWLACDDNGAVAGSIGLGGPDLTFWAAGDQVPALYLYKVMAYPGRGTGLVLLTFAAQRGRSLGKIALRLNCSQDNQALQQYWKANGFTYLRTVEVPGHRAGALFEKSLLPGGPADTVRNPSYRAEWPG